MLVHDARPRAAGKRRNARQQRILPALLGPPRRAQPRPSRGHRPCSKLVEKAVRLGEAQLGPVLGILANRPQPGAPQGEHADQRAEQRQRAECRRAPRASRRERPSAPHETVRQINVCSIAVPQPRLHGPRCDARPPPGADSTRLPAIEFDGTVRMRALVGLRRRHAAAPAVARRRLIQSAGAGFRPLSSLIPVNSRLKLPGSSYTVCEPLHCTGADRMGCENGRCRVRISLDAHPIVTTR